MKYTDLEWQEALVNAALDVVERFQPEDPELLKYSELRARTEEWNKETLEMQVALAQMVVALKFEITGEDRREQMEQCMHWLASELNRRGDYIPPSEYFEHFS